MTTPTPKPKKEKKPIYKRAWFILLAALILAVVLIQAINGSGESNNTASNESETATVEPETASPNNETDISEAPAGESEQVMPWTRHEACQPDDGTAEMISGVLNDSTLQIQNTQIIKDGGDTWIGASLVRPDGDFESRSDVWLMRDGALYSVSNGAGNATWAVKSPGVSMADEYAAGVDRCVVAETMGR